MRCIWNFFTIIGCYFIYQLLNLKRKISNKEIIVHIASRKAFLDDGYILDQLRDLIYVEITIDNRHLQFRLFKCYDLACFYGLVTRGVTYTIGGNFFSLVLFYKSNIDKYSNLC